MDNSKFNLTDRESGKDISVTLLGFTKIGSKVYSVCTYAPNEAADPANKSNENNKNAENNKSNDKIIIFRVKYNKEQKPEFILVQDVTICQKIMDAFYDSELGKD